MGAIFDALPNDAKLAIEWKAKLNLGLALAGGNEMALANQKRFLENSKESLANNPESVRLILIEYKENLAAQDDDDD